MIMRENNKFPKGSEWRKWDLHIHTPLSICQNYGGDNEEIWEKFITDLERLPSEFKVIGINDYLFIDGYEKVLSYKKRGRLANIDLILPVLEFRLNDFSGVDFGHYTRPNIHVIFSNEIQVDIIKSQFLDTLDSKYVLSSNGTAFQRTINKDSLRELGEQIINGAPDKEKPKYGSPLQEGFNNLNLTLEQINLSLQKDCFKGKYLLAIGKTEWDQMKWTDSSIASKKHLINSCDIIFTSAESIEKFQNAKEKLRSQLVKDLLLDCSDAHSFSDAKDAGGNQIKDRIGKCFTWIKADPTFEGLKQIIYEPELRISASYQKPGEKKSYFIIDKVCFLDNTESVNFGSEPIEINSNLTTITGGKSTGKSLLLYYIAKTINPQEVESRAAIEGVPVYYDLDKNPNFNFEVTWRDGQTTQLNAEKGLLENDLKERKILYIPQRYLNTLSEANIKSRDALNKFVLNVILQDPILNTKYQETIREIKIISKSIITEIGELFSEQEDVKVIEEELRQTGDEIGITNYIMTLQGQANDIKTKSGLSDDEITQYTGLVDEENSINAQLSKIKEDGKVIKRLYSTLSSSVNNICASRDEHETYLNNPDIKVKFNEELKIINTFIPSVNLAFSNLNVFIDSKVNFFEEQLSRIKSNLTPLLDKIKLQTELQQKNNELKQEQQKLNEITIKKHSLKTKQQSYKRKQQVIIELYKKILEQYEVLQIEFKKFEDKFGEITLSVHVNFNEDIFNSEVVDDFLNKKNLKKIIIPNELGEDSIYKYDATKHHHNISKIFEGLLTGEINTRKNKHVKDAAIKLLEDYFYIDFRIFYKNDSLDKMSPGKKGLVLLQLLIDLSNEEWPILLDQPEDDLDNRSVYEDLVVFLKTKKLRRQIIIVTHNPNLVVGADAEEVIVANQSGQEIGRENKKFRFEYVTGSIENTFEFDSEQEQSILLRKGIRQHVCEILEGGQEAFQKREKKYNFTK